MASSCENGQRTIVNLPLASCVIISRAMQQNPTDLYIDPLFDTGLRYVSDHSYKETCGFKDELGKNPVLQAILVLAGFLLIVITCFIVCYCRKYNDLKVKYSTLEENDQTGEIEMQTR